MGSKPSKTTSVDCSKCPTQTPPEQITQSKPLSEIKVEAKNGTVTLNKGVRYTLTYGNTYVTIFDHSMDGNLIFINPQIRKNFEGTVESTTIPDIIINKDAINDYEITIYKRTFGGKRKTRKCSRKKS